MVAAVDPQLVAFQMDVFWVYRAGVDPVALLKKYPGIWVSFHLKDLRKGALRAPSPGVSPSSAPPTATVTLCWSTSGTSPRSSPCGWDGSTITRQEGIPSGPRT